ncbi:DNA primase [Candidatus Mycoplasma pogonae]
MDNKIDFDGIVKNSDIVEVVSTYLNLAKKGKNYWSICPFHSDNSPSMSVSREKQLFKCFACQASGNVVTFLMNYNKWDFVKTIKYLAQQQGITLDIQSNFNNNQVIKYDAYEEKMLSALKDAYNLFTIFINASKYQNLQTYLQKRKLDHEIISRFNIGFADPAYVATLIKKQHQVDILINASLLNENEKAFFNNRLTFAIKNNQGDIVGFSARTLHTDAKESKYINSAENSLFQKSEILYNYFDAKEKILFKKEIIIVEGFMDVIAHYRDGIENVVGIMGTALTNQHLKLLKNHRVILNLDGDKAGIAATIKSLKLLIKAGIECFVIHNTSLLDPDEYLTKNGSGSLKQLIENQRMPGIEFFYQNQKATTDLAVFEDVKKFKTNFGELLAYLEKEKQNFYINKIDKEMGIKIDTHFLEEFQVEKKILEQEPNDSFLDYEQQFRERRLEKQNLKSEFIKSQQTHIKRILFLLIKNPHFFETFPLKEVPWGPFLDYMKIGENLRDKHFKNKYPTPLNLEQSKILEALNKETDNLPKNQYSQNYHDLLELLERLKQITIDKATLVAIESLEKEEQANGFTELGYDSKEMIKAINKNIKTKISKREN